MMRTAARRLRDLATQLAYPGPIPEPSAAAQLDLVLRYQQMLRSGIVLPSLSDIGFQVRSQVDEDGILLYLFALAGMGNRRCIEMCAGAGEQSNTANLILTHGWHGLLVEGDPYLVARGRNFYARHPGSRAFPPIYAHHWITQESVNDLVVEHGFTDDIDLLSFDLDGIDWWIWQALEACSPRVVVVEYQEIIGPDACLTVPYSANFNGYERSETRGMPNYAGASLSAYVTLARRKGYRLVGCNRLCFNAFFVRNDILPDVLPEVSAACCFDHPKAQWGMRERWPEVADMEWVDVRQVLA